MKKIIIFLIVAILVIGAGVFYVKNKKKKESETQSQMQYEAVQKGNLSLSVSATGIVKPELASDISPEAEQRGAKLLKLNLEEGDFIKKGEIVAELDKSTSLAQLKAQSAGLRAAEAQLELLLEGARKEDIEKAESSLDSAKSRYLDAKQNYQRTDDLFEKGFISEKDKDSAKTTLDVAGNSVKEAELQLKILKQGNRPQEIERQRASLEQAKANYEQTKAAYESTIIYSPISGTVTDKLMEEGQIVYPASIIAKITDLNTLQIIADVDETDIGRVTVGKIADITFDALPDVTIKGVVSKISSEAKLVQDITYFEVTIELQKGSRGQGVKGSRLQEGKEARTEYKAQNTEHRTQNTEHRFSWRSALGNRHKGTKAQRHKGAGHKTRGLGLETQGTGHGVRDTRHEPFGNHKLLKPGMSADADIIIEERFNTLSVSAMAVKRDKTGDYTVLLKNAKGKEVPKKVEVGLKTSDRYEILKGLKEGDVIVGNYALIRKEEDKPNMIFAPPRGGRMDRGGSGGGRMGGGRMGGKDFR